MERTNTQLGAQGSDSFSFEGREAHLDKLMRWLARYHADDTVLSYPNPDGEYNVNLTGFDMERITAYAAAKYSEAFQNLPKGEVTGDVGFGNLETKVVAMISVSTLGSYVTYIALQRLGLSPLLISPRLAENGYAHLIRVTGCHTAVAIGSSLDMIRNVKKTYDGPLEIVSMLNDNEIFAGLNAAVVELPDPGCTPGHIIHTGGTTGLPKPVPFNIRAWMSRLRMACPNRAKLLCTLPVYHAFGLGTFIRGLRSFTHTFLLNPYRPVTASIIWKALDVTGAANLYTVPYILKFFADMEGGVARLARLDLVRVAGSATPDDLGDLLIQHGVKLGGVYGQTESGATLVQAGSGLGEWNWQTPLPHAERFIRFEQVDDDLYHLVILPGLESLKLSDRPDGSYGTKDLFRPHPDNLPGNDTRSGVAKWKFVARQGDIIVLVNGENADPSPVEQAVMLDPHVQMTVAFGAGHERLGLLIIPSDKAKGLSKQNVIQRLMPALERGNKLAADYAKISPDDIIVKPVGTPYPQTAKMTLQRHVLNKIFADDIEAHYAMRGTANVDGKQMSDDDIRAAVRRVVGQRLQDRHSGPSTSDTNREPKVQGHGLDDDADFFSQGMDSLQSSLVRRRLLHEISLPAGATLATNVVFEYPTVNLLSKHIQNIRQSKVFAHGPKSRDPESIAKAMVRKYTGLITSGITGEYSTTAACLGEKNGNPGHVILLTGATGYIGVQLLNALLNRSDVRLVYCLVRTHQARDDQAAAERIVNAFNNSRLLDELDSANMSKLKCLSSNLAAADLGLSPTDYIEIKASVTAVIHNAWSVNFNMTLESFEPNIASVGHLLNLAKGTSDKQQAQSFVFVSSIAAVGAARSGGNVVQEQLYEWQEAKPRNGYGQSKWVAEQICAAASKSQLAGLGSIRILRVGQVSGDTKHGVWNPAEAIPAMVQSALTIGALPRMNDKQRNVIRWLPSDITAAAITELTLVGLEEFSSRGDRLAVFHISNPHTLRWNEDVLAAVEKAGIIFRALPQREWVRILGEADKNIETNPPYKLFAHFRQVYGAIEDDKSGKRFDQISCNKAEDGAGISRLDLTRSLECSPSLRRAAPVDCSLLVRYVRFWDHFWAEIRDPAASA